MTHNTKKTKKKKNSNRHSASEETKMNTANTKVKSETQIEKATLYTPCHQGNTLLLTSKANSSGAFYAGGWSRHADPTDCYVIDLTGNEYAKRGEEAIEVYDDNSLEAFKSVLETKSSIEVKGWLSFPMPDFGVPRYNLNVWLSLAQDVLNLINKGEKVLVCCAGGHGRTGIAASIICYILSDDKSIMNDNPVQWIRDVHCKEAVETDRQIDYVFDTLKPLGLPDTNRLKTTASKAVVYSYAGGNNIKPPKEKKDIVSSVVDSYERWAGKSEYSLDYDGDFVGF
jgi:protein-tyrosine phosphatase